MRRLFGYLKPYRGRLSFSVTSSVGNKILDLMPPLLVAWVVDTVTRNPPRWIAALAGTNDAWTLAVIICVLGVLIFALESLFQWMYQYGFMTLAQRVQHDLRMDAYQRIQSREIAFFENHRMGETMAMLNDDVNQLERFLNIGFNEIVQLVVLFVFAGLTMAGTSWQLSIIGMGAVPIVIGGSMYYQRLIAPRYTRVREAVGGLASRLENNIGGILVIKSFTAENFETARVEEASRGYRAANEAAIRMVALYVPLIRMAIALSFGGVLLVGGYWVLNDSGVISAGELVFFAMMSQRMLWPLTRLGTTLDEYERAKASALRIFGVLDTPSAIQDPPQPRALGRARGEIEFDDVRFTYLRGQDVLRGLSFRVAPGEMIGIAGPTGAGKSTIIKLLLRLYDVSGGALRIDGLDLRRLRLADLRRNIALVSQDVYLFHGTIRENVAYGLEDVADGQVEHAARLASMHDFITGLPRGYDTIVGERGIKLSGGQRQRLSIARAILKDAPILVLDEATSSVDTETEREIQENLRKLTFGRTALVIAHRLSTIRHADRIIVLRDGQVAEEGHHDDLIARGGTYADLWNIQSGALAEQRT